MNLESLLGALMLKTMNKEVDPWDLLLDIHKENKMVNTNFVLINKDEALVAVSRSLNDDNSRDCLSIEDRGESLFSIKAGSMPCFTDLEENIKDLYINYFDGDLFGKTPFEMADKQVSTQNLEIYAELILDSRVLDCAIEFKQIAYCSL